MLGEGRGGLRWSLPIVPLIFKSNDEFIDPLGRFRVIMMSL